MLLKKLIKSYCLIGFFCYLFGIIYAPNIVLGLPPLLISAATYVIYAVGLYALYSAKDEFYTPFNIFALTLVCSLIGVTLYHQLSLYMDGDQFVFSKVDAFTYYNRIQRMLAIPASEWTTSLSADWGFDDWGAFVFIGAVYSIIESQTFLAIVYCIVASFTAQNIFHIGKNIMSRKYAFIAAFAVTVASYHVVLYSQFLKETVMIYLIVLSFRYFYSFITSRNTSYIIGAYLVALMVLFFRTPTAMIILMSFSVTLILMYTSRVFAIILAGIMFLAVTTTALFIQVYDRYLRGGDFGVMVERKESLAGSGGLVNHLADPIAALFGPFPTLVLGDNPGLLLNSPGLIFRILLVLPFIYGSYYALKYKLFQLYPLGVFFFVSAIGVAVSVKGLEVRLSVTHLFTMYLLAFWWMSYYDNNKFCLKLPQWVIGVFIVGVVGICLLWNVRSIII